MPMSASERSNPCAPTIKKGRFIRSFLMVLEARDENPGKKGSTFFRKADFRTPVGDADERVQTVGL